LPLRPRRWVALDKAGARYRHVFVDEFQDTDPVQAEILFRIASHDAAYRWQDCEPRPGALFMVGDPKQAIYQFRGANVGSYGQARTAIKQRWPDNVVQITANFRSRPDILAHVNRCFETPLSAPGQPGYVALTPTLPAASHDLPCVAKIMLDLPPDPRPEDIRDAEAAAVADLCAQLVGNLKIREPLGTIAPLTPGGIALLAPTSWELWRYERALEAKGLPIASQAGKGMFRRQEVQDLLSLARVLADAGDTLAFGALMRGPLVGLTEEELLDITASLPVFADRPAAIPRFSVLTDPALVSHPVAREILSILRDLRRRSRATTPMLLLAEAVERLAIRPILAAREADRSTRASANVEAFLEQARSYGVKGLKRFVRDVTKEWEAGTSANEGRVDTEGDAIEIVTIHSSKGLEWPVVISINTATLLRSREEFVHRESDDTLHWMIGDVAPPDLRLALEADDENLARERERVWYVACTRAKELLIVPQLSAAAQNSWARVIDLAHAELPALDLSKLDHARFSAPIDLPNPQTAELFAAERAVILAAAMPITWLIPSDSDPDRMPVAQAVAADVGEAPEREIPVGAGRMRGLILHKLMEEVLTGELAEDLSAFAHRAGELLIDLPIDATSEGTLPAAEEIASTTWNTLHLAEIVALRSKLVPELPLYAMLAGEPDQLALAGRADAIAFDNGLASVVLDWKSDIAPTSQDIRTHTNQLQHYMMAIGAPRGALVYMTPGTVHWVGATTTAA
jgi:ATP-dependent exoDNAse (exonuclease V) beta subunit